MCENDVKIGIIGAGIAGIYAAKILYENNFKNFWIFEATDRIGGRIWSVKHENNWIELGAQWVHGQVDNCLYEYANARNLIADPITDHGVEGNGYYCNFNGDIIDCSAAKELVKYLDEQKENMNSAVAAGQNVFDYFCKHFERFIEDSAVDKHSKIYRNLLDMFRWYIVYEVIDNSCDQNLRELSPLSYSEWKDCDGVVDLLNFRGNYSSIFDEFRKDFPLDDHLRLKHEVTRISLMNDQKMVKLTISDDQNVEIEFDFNHVIITSSIGFLKENLKSGKFFNFNLPEPKQAIIEAIGFGTINKIFLHFTRPFWSDDCKGIQCIWSNITDDHSYPEGHMNGSSIDNDDHHGLPQWIYCIQGFDRVRNQPNMLMAWIGGLGAKEMENYSDIEISNVLHRILQRIVPKQCLIRPIDRPDKIYCTRWYSNRFQRGSYSNRTMSYHSFGDSNKNAKTTHLNSSSSEQFEYNVDVLAEPIYDDTDAAADGADADDTAENRTPLILFAGEATDRHHYSTTHGAMNSGRREAWRLINYYRHKHNKNTN